MILAPLLKLAAAAGLLTAADKIAEQAMTDLRAARAREPNLALTVGRVDVLPEDLAGFEPFTDDDLAMASSCLCSGVQGSLRHGLNLS